MTDKDLRDRYPDALSVVADLEEALAIEAARSGRSTGEATAVLRTLPASARRRLPFRMRHSIPVLAVLLLLGAGAGVVALLAREGVERTQRGTGAGKIEAQPGQEVVSVAADPASDYDPQGDEEEHADEAQLAVDRQLDTTWSTETYRDGLAGAQKEGVGIYVDADPGVAASGIEIRTPAPGFKVDIYAASGDEPPADLDGWTRLAGGRVRRDRQSFDLDTEGERYRYYLAWITELTEDGTVEIAEIALSAPENEVR
jgi:serine/threonine-protein kinase